MPIKIMQNKIKILLLMAISGAGLLLGGNTLADGMPSRASDTQNLSAQIDQIRQKISDLSAQMPQNQVGQSGTAANQVQLTAEKLNYIQSEIARIANETARLKIEVGIFATLREINRKTAQLSLQMGTATKTAPIAISSQPAATSISEQKKQEIEAQIAKIKVQIGELNQELQAQKNIELNAMTQTASDQCELGGTCSINSSDSESAAQTSAASQSVSSQTSSTANENKGFWQSVGDFLKKIFTF